MTRYEKALAAARGFAELVDPYELMDEGMDDGEFVEETARLLMEEPSTVMDYFEEV